MVGLTGGERYYWMVDLCGCVSMMPAFMVENTEHANNSKTKRSNRAAKIPSA